MRARRALVVALLLFGVASHAACSSSVRVTDGDADTDSSPDGDADADVDADADGDDDSDADLEAEFFGELMLFESADPQIADMPSVAFGTRRSVELDARCGGDDEVPMGECRVLTRRENPAGDCGPECIACGRTDDCDGWRCVQDDASLLMEAGEVSITGGAQPCTCALQPGTLIYFCCGEHLSPTSFEPGDVLTISAPGGSYPGFSVTTEVLPRPRITSEWTIESFDGTRDLRVSWEPSGHACRMDVVVTRATHSPDYIRCETDDDGELVIPASTIAEISGPLVPYIRVELTRVNETTTRPSADSVFTARSSNTTMVEFDR
jgi:hypothetical protein